MAATEESNQQQSQEFKAQETDVSPILRDETDESMLVGEAGRPIRTAEQSEEDDLVPEQLTHDKNG